MKFVSIALILVSAFLSVKHGWEALNANSHPEALKMMSDLGIGRTFVPILGVITILSGIMLFIPQTFIFGNLVNAITIVIIMALALNAGNVKMALMEIPFFALPLLLIWLKYPFKF